MIKRLFIAIVAIVAILPLLPADNFMDHMAAYSKNQASIKTYVAMGKISIEIRSASNGQLLSQNKLAVTVYLKSPDMYKMIISGQSPSVVVQKGNLITQKIAGTNTIVTSKASDSTSMFEKFFNLGVADAGATAQVVDTAVVSEDGVQLEMFAFKPLGGQLKGIEGEASSIDRSEVYFDPNGMLAKTIVYSDGKPIAVTKYKYVQKAGIYALSSVDLLSMSSKGTIRNITEYSAVSVNTEIADHEFELK
jgi:outer membrane lipoprotein-sorting protein